jgi:hypothetical protein
MHTASAEERAGFHLARWCEAVGISRGFYYTLPPELQPESVKLGKRRIITEKPRDYLKRVAGHAASVNG